MDQGAVSTDWYEYRNEWTYVKAEVIKEALVTLYMNGEELATVMVTPTDLECFAIGFLKNERLIDAIEDIDHIHSGQKEWCVDVWLCHSIKKPERLIITSGCGGGVTFEDPSFGVEPLKEETYIDPVKLFELFRMLHFPGSLYSRSRGVHAAGISDGVGLLAIAEDVGRHNTVDKIVGACMQKGIDPRGCLLLATGRVSSEMVHKGALMGCPIIASRNSPTSMSIAMARAWNITLIGYVRQRTMRVYSHPERLGAKISESLSVLVD